MSMTANREQSVGLEWIQEPFALVPRWTMEPDLEMIKQVVSSSTFSTFSLQEISATFLTQGALNKIYNLRIGEDNFIMRVSLPVEPRWKTLSEVATVEWIRRNTRLPVPRILAHDESRENVIGFEWILMSKLPGSPLADVWRTMQFPAKKKLVQELAIYSSALFKKQLRGIGSIYAIPRCKREDDGDGDSDGDDLPEVKRIVSMQFFWGNRLSHPIARGPFRCSKDWIAACLSCNEHDCHAILSRCNQKEELDSDDQYNLKDARRTLNIIDRLKPLLSDIFPSGEQDDAEPEPSMLFHDDLSRHNILVDDAGDLTGVVDWECVSALPLWKACYYPYFLETPARSTEPNRDDYGIAEDDDEEESGTLYWEDLLEYESTMLRQYFLDEMRRLEPGWIKVFEASQVKRDFDLAARYCGSEFVRMSIGKWIDGIASGKANPRSLQEIIDGF